MVRTLPTSVAVAMDMRSSQIFREREAGDSVIVWGRPKVHISQEIAKVDGFMRKRVQPVGTVQCTCGRTVSANKSKCKECM